MLAEWILQRGGVVFGATFDENLRVRHVAVEKRHELYKLRGSKYLQSEASGVFFQIKQYLDEERYVLFTGTPCQVDGLLHMLNRDYERLFTQDIICHGVPSDKVWQEYLAYQIELHGNTPLDKAILPSFRRKTNGWLKFSMHLTFEDGTIYDEVHDEDLYMKLFLRNISLRPSCYQCCSKTLNRNSDITLADFWGIENIIKDMYDGLGTSLVLVNSDKGRGLFSQIAMNLRCTKVDIEKSVAYNPSAFSSVSIPYKRQRKVFFRGLGKDKFDALVDKSLRITLFDRIWYRIRCFLKNSGTRHTMTD